MHILNDSSTPLEELLLKLIRFFKSYTIDVIGLDTLFVCDMKSKNILHYFDEIVYANKLELLKERFKLSYSDVIHLLSSHMDESDNLKFKEKFETNKLLYLTKPEFNHIYLTDELLTSTSTKQSDKSLTKLEDSLNSVLVDTTIKDSFKIHDGIIKSWYSE